MNVKCPSCGSTDLNFETRTCRNCGDSIDATPQRVLEPAEREEAALLQDVEDATEAMEAAATEEEKRIAYETWEERVFQYYEKGFRIVTLIGFSGAGKTFLAHRLRRELSDDWTVLPPHADVIRGTDITIEWTQLVSKTTNPRRRVLADCDGEAFRLAIDALMNGRDIDPKMRRSIVITALASAYILMLPAEELMDRSKYKLTNRLIERFDMIVKAILALQRIVQRSRSAREALHEGLKLESIAEALQYEFRCEQPIHVLFAQADKMPAQHQHEGDPHMYALAHARTLYRTIESHFTNFRFDYCCAFDGHNANNTFEVDYNLPSYGTVAAFDWIDDMLEAGPRDRRRTAMAMKIRRLFDPAFRKMSARVSG
jgi:ribose 1,5-bisphosphokinase PhnN